MSKVYKAVSILTLSLLFAGCGSSTKSVDAIQAAQLSGVFVGQMTPGSPSTNPANAGKPVVTVQITFTGEQASADGERATLGGSAVLTPGCGVTAVFQNGTLLGHNLSGVLQTNDGGVVTLGTVSVLSNTTSSGVVSDSRISGSISIAGGACDGETGTLNLLKQ